MLYSLRRYDRVLVAETQMDVASSGKKDSGSPAGEGDKAFNALAKYIFGGNASSTKMQMTTPVFTDGRGAMQFVIDPSIQVSAPYALVRGQLQGCMCNVSSIIYLKVAMILWKRPSPPAPSKDRVHVIERPNGKLATFPFFSTTVHRPAVFRQL